MYCWWEEEHYLSGKFVCHHWCSLRNSISPVSDADSLCVVLGVVRVDNNWVSRNGWIHQLVIIHATLSHRLSPLLKNCIEKDGKRCVCEQAHDWPCVYAMCACLRDVSVKRTIEAACDYASLISYSKWESARLPCIMTNFNQTEEYSDIRLVIISSL